MNGKRAKSIRRLAKLMNTPARAAKNIVKKIESESRGTSTPKKDTEHGKR